MKLRNYIPQLIVGLFVLAILVVVGAFESLEAGITLAIGGLYSSDMQHHRDLLSSKMKKVSWNVPGWSYFMGKINTMDQEATHKFGTKVFKPTGKPIEIFNDFRVKSGGTMDIPVYYPLTGKGVSGTKQLLGNEEQPKVANIQTKINQKRHGVIVQDSKVSKQMLNKQAVKQLMTGASTKLGDWFQRWNGYNISLAFLQGCSEHLASAVADGGIAMTKVSHMNTYVAGSGKVAFSTTHATYEAAVASALGGLTATASDYMSTGVIKRMVYEASHTHRITPPIKGSKLYPIMLSDAAMIQLAEDDDFLKAMHEAELRGKNNPIFTGMYGGIAYAGALLFVDETLPSAYLNGDSDFVAANSTTGTTAGVQYGLGSDFMETPVDTGNLKPAILFGASAIGVGIASDIAFESETWDYGQKNTEGADMMIGHTVADIIDADGYWGLSGNKRKENVSSLVAWTYSPSASSWT